MIYQDSVVLHNLSCYAYVIVIYPSEWLYVDWLLRPLGSCDLFYADCSLETAGISDWLYGDWAMGTTVICD